MRISQVNWVPTSDKAIRLKGRGNERCLVLERRTMPRLRQADFSGMPESRLDRGYGCCKIRRWNRREAAAIHSLSPKPDIESSFEFPVLASARAQRPEVRWMLKD